MLVRVMGFEGLALATSLAAIVNACIQLVMLRRELGGIEAGRIAMTLVKTTVAAAGDGVPRRGTRSGGCERLLPGDDDRRCRRLRVFGAIGVALGVLTAAAWVLRLREFEQARSMVVRRFAGCALKTIRSAPDGLGDRVNALRRRRVRQHVRAAACRS